jgi:hypothetical protein
LQALLVVSLELIGDVLQRMPLHFVLRPHERHEKKCSYQRARRTVKQAGIGRDHERKSTPGVWRSLPPTV